MKYEKLTGAAQYALEALKNAGADKAVVTAFNGSTTEFNIDGGEFSLMRTIFNEGVGVTAYVGGRNGGASTNALDRESIDGAARDAVAAAQSAVPDDAWDISPACEPQDFPSGALECDREFR